MKNFYSLMFCLTLGLAYAQIPGTFSFQGVARDAEGNILANNNIEAIVSISSDIDGTNVLYNESHAATTNAFGVFSLEVGNGSGKSGVLENIGWGSGDKFIHVSFRPEAGQYGDPVTQKLLTVPYALYAKNVDNVNDADADSTNELQTLSVNDSLLSISGGNTVKLTDLGDGFEANTDDQTLELTDGTLSISGGNEVDISVIDKDDQTLSLDVPSAMLTISNGNTVDLGPLGADTDDQAIDVIGLNGTNLELSLEDDGEATRTVDLSPINTDNQALGLSGDNLSLTNGGSVDLSGYTNTDNQSLSYNATTDEISLTNGGSIDITEVNTDNQSLSYNAGTDEISIGGGNTIDISEVNTDNQSLSYNSTTDVISIAGGNSIDISELDTDTDTDDQTLSYNASTDVITIVDGNSIDITEVNTDNQNLSYNPTTDEISIGGGNTIDITEVDTDTDDQTLSYNTSTDVISIADGNSIDITEVNTDNQNLSYNPTTDEISIGGGNTIDITEVDTDTDDQTLSYNTTTDVISIADGNSIDITEVNTDNQTLSYNISTDVISIAGGNSIDITEVDTDDQTLSFNAVSDQLTIAGGNTVGLSGVDDQTLSFSGTTLTIAGGNSVNLSSLASSSQAYFLGQITTNYRAVALDAGGINYGEGKRIDFDKVEIDLRNNYDPDKDIFTVGEDATYQISWNLQLTSIEGTVGYIFMVVLNSSTTGSVAYLNKESGIARDVPFTENGSITLYLRGGDEVELVLIESGAGIQVNSQVFGATVNDDGSYNNDPGNGFVDPRMNYVRITQLN